MDDKTAEECGKCGNCSHESIFDNSISQSELDNALKYINNLEMPIEPRKKWPIKELFDELFISYQLSTGICLSRYGDVGYGKMVQSCKYDSKKFNDELVEKSAAVLKETVKKENIKYITSVPSLRSDMVADFTKRLAKSLKIEYKDILYKTDAPQQKKMENSYHQCRNARDSFHVKSGIYNGNIILVDDVIDSKWTITVCGYYLMKNGFTSVFPYALADSSHNEEE